MYIMIPLHDTSDLLQEENAKWLAARKFQQEERDLVEKARRQASTGIQKDFIRYHSRRGSYKTITFSSVDIFPKLFSSAAPQPPAKVIPTIIPCIFI